MPITVDAKVSQEDFRESYIPNLIQGAKKYFIVIIFICVFVSFLAAKLFAKGDYFVDMKSFLLLLFVDLLLITTLARISLKRLFKQQMDQGVCERISQVYHFYEDHFTSSKMENAIMYHEITSVEVRKNTIAFIQNNAIMFILPIRDIDVEDVDTVINKLKNQ